MKKSKKIMGLACAIVMASAACSKKSEDPVSPPPTVTLPTETVVMTKKEISAVLTRNQDGTAAIDLTLPDANGVNISHLGIANLNQETELRSADGKSIVALRSYLNHDVLMAAQFQVDRNDARLFILTLNQKNGGPNAYELILNAIKLERANALARADAMIGEASEACQYNGASKAFAAVSDYFQKNPTSTLEQYLEAKHRESNSSDDGRCAIVDFGVGPDGKIIMIPVAKPSVEPKRPKAERPRSHRHQSDVLDELVGKQREEPQAPFHHQHQAPPQYQNPPQHQAPPSQQAPPQYQGQPQTPPPQQVPPQQQPVPQPVVEIPQGYHTNWEACYASGHWRTDGNRHCKKKWWSNCSPEEGGRVCKIKTKKDKPSVLNSVPGTYALDPLSQPVIAQPETQAPAPPSSQSPTLEIGEWITDFSYCYSVGKWQTDGNTNCKSASWPSCSPETGAEKCRTVYKK